MKLRIGIELRKDFIVIDIKTTRNTSLTYEIPTICNKKSAIAWLIKVIKTPELLVGNISLDDITRSNDEGNSSITIDSDISCLEEEVDIPNGVEHSFEKPHEGITIAYHRDRGESGCESRTTTLKQFAKDIEYAYLYKDGKWEEYEEPRKEY